MAVRCARCRQIGYGQRQVELLEFLIGYHVIWLCWFLILGTLGSSGHGNQERTLPVEHHRRALATMGLPETRSHFISSVQLFRSIPTHMAPLTAFAISNTSDSAQWLSTIVCPSANLNSVANPSCFVPSLAAKAVTVTTSPIVQSSFLNPTRWYKPGIPPWKRYSSTLTVLILHVDVPITVRVRPFGARHHTRHGESFRGSNSAAIE